MEGPSDQTWLDHMKAGRKSIYDKEVLYLNPYTISSSYPRMPPKQQERGRRGPRGRPQKYMTEQERTEATRLRRLKSYHKQRARKKEEECVAGPSNTSRAYVSNITAPCTRKLLPASNDFEIYVDPPESPRFDPEKRARFDIIIDSRRGNSNRNNSNIRGNSNVQVDSQRNNFNIRGNSNAQVDSRRKNSNIPGNSNIQKRTLVEVQIYRQERIPFEIQQERDNFDVNADSLEREMEELLLSM